jgi:hypothetical protein
LEKHIQKIILGIFLSNNNSRRRRDIKEIQTYQKIGKSMSKGCKMRDYQNQNLYKNQWKMKYRASQKEMERPVFGSGLKNTGLISLICRGSRRRRNSKNLHLK